ncbi:MAG: protein kinase [Candidatus Aminicenantes bacterium]|nr:protein kinase [Candidatus Aminicenantes bacterium]
MKCPKCDFENPGDTHFCSNCGTKLDSSRMSDISQTETIQTPLKGLSRGAVFAQRYEVIEELGKGGMGKVYKVIDNKINEKIALKILKPEIAADEKTIIRFQNELKLSRKIAHRNVCRMYHLGEEKGTYYITMEYIPGEDLKSSLRRVGPLSPGKAVSITKQICEGLVEAHATGIVHRDLKPHNIMIDSQGNARIMDFGIARSVKNKGITGTGVIIGTPEYMSPEQVERREVDARSDIYSLGIILYEMTTGKVPFEGDTPLNIAIKQKTEAPPDPKKINPQLPEKLRNLILKCMEKDRGKRYQTAEAVLQELGRIDQDLPSTQRVVPRRKPLTSKEITVKISARRFIIPLLILCILTLGFFFVWNFFFKDTTAGFSKDGYSLAVVYFENNTGDSSLDHWRKTLSDLLIADISQSKYVSVLSEDKLFNLLSKMEILDVSRYSSDDLRRIAKETRAEKILTGRYAKAGDNFRIDVVLYDTDTMERMGSERVEKEGEENIFLMVDELTKTLKEKYFLSPEEIDTDVDRNIGTLPSGTREAYRIYNEGNELFNAGNYNASIKRMEKAISIHSGFAEAYRTMALAQLFLGYRIRSRESMAQARKKSGGLSDREKLQIQADASWMGPEKDISKAISLYEKFLSMFPEDRQANTNLGLLYLEMEDWDRALERFEVLEKNKDQAVHPYLGMARAYRAKGDSKKAEKILQYFLENWGENARIRNELALSFFSKGAFDAALAEAKKAAALDASLSQASVLVGDIYCCLGNYSEAEKHYGLLLQSKEAPVRMMGIKRTLSLQLYQGKFRTAVKLAQDGISLAEESGDAYWKTIFLILSTYVFQRTEKFEAALETIQKAEKSVVDFGDDFLKHEVLHIKGIVYLSNQAPADALKTTNELQTLIKSKESVSRMRYAFHLKGKVEQARMNYIGAIDLFEDAVSRLPAEYSFSDDHVLFYFTLAEAYYNRGSFDKAEDWYKKILSLSSGRISYGDLYAISLYRLGTIFQEKGRISDALGYYERFLSVWKYADPGAPGLIDASRRMSVLQSRR